MIRFIPIINGMHNRKESPAAHNFQAGAGSSMTQLKSRVADNAINETCRNFSNLSFVLRLEC